jgi:hydrogenase/urease accessory protein HupE
VIRVRRLLLGLAASLVLAIAAAAHESRPAYLEIEEVAPERYAVLWRAPVRSGMPLPVELRLPEGARDVTAPALRELSDSTVERRVIEVAGGLEGQRIEFAGLPATITDVLVRVQRADGTHAAALVRPAKPWVAIEAAPSRLAVTGAYVQHGVSHILEGVDHLLFLLALLWIVPGRRTLLVTITSFTLAHSITLGLATLGFVRVPGPPVEAMVAFSILLLAAELVRMQRGERSLTAERPWLVAFGFGLLHGLGFAGALTQIGLPPGEVPLALLSFNVGVELGQLAFLALVVPLGLALRAALGAAVLQRARPIAGYAIGIVAAFWFVERLASFRI